MITVSPSAAGSTSGPDSQTTPIPVIFCRHSAETALAEIDDGSVHVVADLCIDPEPIGRLLANRRGVIVGCERGPSISQVRHVLSKARLGLAAVEQVQIDRRTAPTAIRRLIASLRARLADDRPPVATRWIADRSRGVSRRQLLRIAATEQVVVPDVQPDKCHASSGCRACVTACPFDAISVGGGLPEIDLDACIPCGLCVTTCPTGAMVDPSSHPARIERQVTAGLTGASTDHEAMGIVFNCRHQPRIVSDGWIPVDVSATAGVGVGWMLAPLMMGASGVAVPRCAACHSDSVAEGRVDLCRRLLEACGLPVDAVTREPVRPGDSFPVRARLDDPFGPAGVSRTLTILLDAATGTVSLDHATSPVGVIEIGEACVGSLMCVAICPTQALGMRIEDHAIVVEWTGGRCTACGQCLVVCPEIDRGSIRLTGRIDLAALSPQTHGLKRHQSVRCRECGGDIMPADLLDRVGALMQETGAPPEDLRTCPGCMESALLEESRRIFNRS